MRIAWRNGLSRRPMIFNTNGFETYFWDDKTGPQRKVSGIFSQNDLERLMERRMDIHPALRSIPISDEITNRVYRKRLSVLFVRILKQVVERISWLWLRVQVKPVLRQAW